MPRQNSGEQSSLMAAMGGGMPSSQGMQGSLAQAFSQPAPMPGGGGYPGTGPVDAAQLAAQAGISPQQLLAAAQQLAAQQQQQPMAAASPGPMAPPAMAFDY